DPEARALSDGALDLEAGSMRAEDAANGRETQTAARSLGRVERVEDLRDGVGRHAHARVGDLEDDETPAVHALLREALRSRARIDGLDRGAQTDGARLR